MRHPTFVELHLLYLLYLWYLLLWLPVKNDVQKRDIGWGPQPSLSLIFTEAFAARRSLAHSMWPLTAAQCSGVAPQHRRSGARRCEHRRRSLSSPRSKPPRMSTAAPFATRNATIAGWSSAAARCSAATPPGISKTSEGWSRQRWSRRMKPRTAGRSPKAAAQAMSLPRRVATRNEDVFLLWSLCFL